MPPEHTESDDFIVSPKVVVHEIRSTFVAQTFRIQVAMPPRKPSITAPLPVVYLTDGNIVFSMFKEIAAMLHGNAFPDFILVGIGYPSDIQFAGTFLRMRDFTTPEHPRVEKQAARRLFPIEGILFAEEGGKDHGGAEDFSRFIGEELIPFIDDHYETIPGARTYFGHSGGGFFGLFSLFTQSELFQNYCVSSPSLFWHGETPGGYQYDNFDFGMQMARSFVNTNPVLNDVKIYLSVGADEEFQPGYENGRLVSSFYEMASLLKRANIPGLEVLTEVHLGETHFTVWPVAFIHGIRAVFQSRGFGAKA